MKILLKAIALLVIVSAADVARAGAFKFSIALPVESLMTDDLDARDELNRPIASSSVRVHFVELWSRGLNEAVLNSLTPGRVKMFAILNASWGLFAEMLHHRSGQLQSAVRWWINIKRTQLQNISQEVISSIVSHKLLSRSKSEGSAFLFFLHLLISSTRLLR